MGGSFSEEQVDEIVVAKGKILELLRPDAQTGKIEVVGSCEVFGLIRSLLTFRLMGMQRDFLVIGSDSGRMVIVEWNKQKAKFVKVVQETFGKTGCRRIVPGEFLAADPKGRALLIGAIERQKFVYQMNRD